MSGFELQNYEGGDGSAQRGIMRIPALFWGEAQCVLGCTRDHYIIIGRSMIVPLPLCGS
jgi:hypothetical protein